MFPGDEICVIGTDEQITQFTNYLENQVEATNNIDETEIVLRQLEISNEDFVQKSIGQFRAKTGGLVVGIERNGNRILNPESHLILEKNDIIWVVGDKKRMNELTKKSVNIPI